MYKNTPPEKIKTFEGIETTFAQTRAESHARWKPGQPRQRRIIYPIVKKIQQSPVKRKQNLLNLKDFHL